MLEQVYTLFGLAAERRNFRRLGRREMTALFDRWARDLQG